MGKKKFKLLYNADVIANGAHKDAARSGIYFAALNFLKQMSKRNDLEITLYVSNYRAKSLGIVLKKYFPDNKWKVHVIRDIPEKSLFSTISFISTQYKCFLSKLLINFFIYTDYYAHVLYRIIQCYFLRFKHFDAVFSPNSSFTKAIDYMKIEKRYIFLYDMILKMFPHYYPVSANHWFHKLLASLNGNDTYFADSNSARNDFLTYNPRIDPEKIHTVYLGCNYERNTDEKEIKNVKAKYHIPDNKKYLFSLCSMEPRKNLVRIVKTFIQFVNKNNIDNMVLVMGGGQWNVFKEKFNKATSGLSMDSVLQIGYVDDEDLATLYSGAEWFTYTSEYEGFGLPVLEAMKCGCPVITANNSSLPEVIGDAGIQIDWDSDEQHIAAYEKYYFDENLRKENIHKGLKRAELFTWDKTANQMIDIMLKNKN